METTEGDCGSEKCNKNFVLQVIEIDIQNEMVLSNKGIYECKQQRNKIRLKDYFS